jgi:hypothetical protein
VLISGWHVRRRILGLRPRWKNDPVPGVMVDVHHFKKAPPNILCWPLLDIHKDKIKKKIMQYNKFDTKVPIFAIPKDPKSLGHILPQKPRKWEDIQNHQFLIVRRQHIITVEKVHFLCIIVFLWHTCLFAMWMTRLEGM